MVKGPKGSGSSKDAGNLADGRWGNKATRHDGKPGEKKHYQNKSGDGQHVMYKCGAAAVDCSPVGDIKDIYAAGKEVKDTTKEYLGALESTLDTQAKQNDYLHSCDDLSDDDITNYMRRRIGK